jgi:hypothetical protein
MIRIRAAYYSPEIGGAYLDDTISSDRSSRFRDKVFLENREKKKAGDDTQIGRPSHQKPCS